jgi:pimeloyl-ACP methyl ester carboxylesterase
MARQLPQLPGVKHRFVSIGEFKNHVAIAGEGDPVVLLHGWPEHWYAWRAVIPRLAERYQVLCPDLRGFGWTDIAWEGFEKENLADDLLRLLDAMDIDRIRLVGHDWGGWIGFLLALRRPERIRQLVALNVPPPWPRVTPRTLVAARHFSYQLVLASPLVGPRMLQRRPGYVRRLMRRSAHRDVWTKEDFRIYSRELMSPPRARASALLYRTFLLRELLPVVAGRYRRARLTTPTLLLHGERDRAVSKHLISGYERHADDLRVEFVAEAGHYLPEERPELVADRTLEFFGAAGRSRAGSAAERA